MLLATPGAARPRAPRELVGNARQSVPEILRTRRVEWLGVAVIALALALSFSLGSQLRRAMRGDEVDWVLVSDANLVHFSLWALLYPVVVVTTVRFPLGERRGRHLLLHLLAAFAFSPLLMTLTHTARAALSGEPGLGFPRLVEDAIVPEFAWGLTAYLILLSVAHAAEYRRRQRDAATNADRLEAALVAARLQCLRTQLQPHFLFNTLNLVSSLIRRDPEAAERMVTRLGDFLRLTLDDDAPSTISLRRELELLDGYLEIERARFRDRLSVEIDVAPTAYETPVPYLILQPLAENALRHGVGERAGPGRVTIRARVRWGALILDVEDSGNATSSPDPSGNGRGVGLSNTRARLENLYGRHARVRVGTRRAGGTRARVILPERREAPEPRGRT
jgi:two-component system LytT family sensor kinase